MTKITSIILVLNLLMFTGIVNAEKAEAEEQDGVTDATSSSIVDTNDAAQTGESNAAAEKPDQKESNGIAADTTADITFETADRDARKEMIAKERAAREMAARVRAARAEAAREMDARLREARAEAAREMAARVRAAREEAAIEMAARVRAAREEAAIEMAARVRAAREEAAREMAAREKERAARERYYRERMNRY